MLVIVLVRERNQTACAVDTIAKILVGVFVEYRQHWTLRNSTEPLECYLQAMLD